MTPEAERYLAKARQSIEHARMMLAVGLTDEAGRAAYQAGFHAAQALISNAAVRSRNPIRGCIRSSPG